MRCQAGHHLERERQGCNVHAHLECPLQAHIQGPGSARNLHSLAEFLFRAGLSQWDPYVAAPLRGSQDAAVAIWVGTGGGQPGQPSPRPVEGAGKIAVGLKGDGHVRGGFPGGREAPAVEPRWAMAWSGGGRQGLGAGDPRVAAQEPRVPDQPCSCRDGEVPRFTQEKRCPWGPGMWQETGRQRGA